MFSAELAGGVRRSPMEGMCHAVKVPGLLRRADNPKFRSNSILELQDSVFRLLVPWRTFWRRVAITSKKPQNQFSVRTIQMRAENSRNSQIHGLLRLRACLVRSGVEDVSPPVAEVPIMLLLCWTLVVDGAVHPKREAEFAALDRPIALASARDDRRKATWDNVSQFDSTTTIPPPLGTWNPRVFGLLGPIRYLQLAPVLAWATSTGEGLG